MSVYFISALILMAGMAAVARGFAPLIRDIDAGFPTHIVSGVTIMVIVLVFRSGYWDITQFIAGDMWPEIYQMLGGQQISSVFNLLMLWAVYHFLRARWFLIPDEERGDWYWFTAWAHPGSNCVINWRKGGRV